MTTRLRRPEIGAFVLAVVLALVAGTVLWSRSVERTHTTVVTRRALPIRAAADDCPAGITCTDGAPRPVLAQVLGSALPGVQVLDGYAVYGVDPNRPYREVLQARTSGGVAVQITARRVEGGSAVAAQASGSVPASGPATVAIVVPGAPGCSVAVILDVPAGVAVPLAAADRVARDPALQLSG